MMLAAKYDCLLLSQTWGDSNDFCSGQVRQGHCNILHEELGFVNIFQRKEPWMKSVYLGQEKSGGCATQHLLANNVTAESISLEERQS